MLYNICLLSVEFPGLLVIYTGSWWTMVENNACYPENWYRALLLVINQYERHISQQPSTVIVGVWNSPCLSGGFTLWMWEIRPWHLSAWKSVNITKDKSVSINQLPPNHHFISLWGQASTWRSIEGRRRRWTPGGSWELMVVLFSFIIHTIHWWVVDGSSYR